MKQFKKKMGKAFSCLDSKESAELSFRKRMVIIGDGECGKTCLVTRMSTGNFTDVGYLPTVFETEVVNVNTGKEDVELTIFDTAGQEDYDRLRPFSYHDIDVALLCFNLADTDTLINVTEKWSPEVRYFCGSVPIILVGNKKDLRDTPDISAKSLPLSRSMSFDSKHSQTNGSNDDHDDDVVDKDNESGSVDSSAVVEKENRLSMLMNPKLPSPRVPSHVKHSDGALIAKRIGAVAYFETSALTGENVEELLLVVTKASVLGSKKSKKFKPFIDTLKTWTFVNKTIPNQSQESKEEMG